MVCLLRHTQRVPERSSGHKHNKIRDLHIGNVLHAHTIQARNIHEEHVSIAELVSREYFESYDYRLYKILRHNFPKNLLGADIRLRGHLFSLFPRHCLQTRVHGRLHAISHKN